MEQIEYIVQTNGISKQYKSQLALNNVNMNIARGDIYGFVGENGSGKTTIIRVLTGIIFASQGTFKLFGVDNTSKDIYKARSKVGAIVETPSIYKNMSAYDNLRMQCSILGIKNYKEKIEETLDIIGLGYLRDSKKTAGHFSLGMRQRLGIGMALLGDVEFLILDEPMNGLDPAGIVEIRELILKLNKEKNITFLISSHILTELQLVATKYGIISKGKIIKEISAEELVFESRKSLVIETEDVQKAYDCLIVDYYSKDIKVDGNKITITDYVNLNELLLKLSSYNINITKINTFNTTIEDYYLSFIGGDNNA